MHSGDVLEVLSTFTFTCHQAIHVVYHLLVLRIKSDNRRMDRE